MKNQKMKVTELEKKYMRDIQSQQYYIDHLPVEELMTWPNFKLNVFDQLDDLKYLLSTREAKETI